MSKAEEILKEQKIVKYQKYFHKAMKSYAEKFGEWLLKEAWQKENSTTWYKVFTDENGKGTIVYKTTSELIEMFEQEVK